MLRLANLYGVCIACGLCFLLFLAGSRYTDNVNYRPGPERRRNIRNYLKITSEESIDTNYGGDDKKNFGDSPYDISHSNVERILEKTHSKIKFELGNFSFENDLKLEDLLIENGGNPLRTLIISSWRSGTTFLGEVLNSVPGNFYHYEPLLNYEIIQIRGPPHAKKALRNLKKLLHCDYEDMEEYFEYGRTHLHLFHHNTRLWDFCKHDKDLCFDPVFSSKFCKLFPFQSMKVVRLRLRLVEELLQDSTLNLKVLLLIRDPRGVLQSRQHRNFCPPSPDCSQPALLCADMVSDYVAAQHLLKTYPDRLMVLRYEDLALNPNVTSHAVLRFLAVGHHSSVDDFLRSHTNMDVAGVSSTFRVSKEVPFRWKNVLDFNYVSSIQGACKEAMSHWGYRAAYNASHMSSNDFDPLLPYTV